MPARRVDALQPEAGLSLHPPTPHKLELSASPAISVDPLEGETATV